MHDEVSVLCIELARLLLNVYPGLLGSCILRNMTVISQAPICFT